MTKPQKINGKPMPKPPTPKQVVFKSDLPIEQAAYEATAKALGYEPVLYPYEDEEHKAVYAKYERAVESLREMSRE